MSVETMMTDLLSLSRSVSRYIIFLRELGGADPFSSFITRMMSEAWLLPRRPVLMSLWRG